MKTERNIFIAFLLNLSFSILEFVGGALTGSVAIVSDAVHDMGDAASIAVSYFLERKSKRRPDEHFTHGYVRYSVLGSVITTVILLFGSITVIYNAIGRLFNPVEIHYNGMITLAIVGVAMNLLAAYITRDGKSMNQKSVSLHMMEDVLGWIVVLIGAIVMGFTDISILDPLMSIGVSAFILFHALKNLKEILNLFLEKIPAGLSIEETEKQVAALEGIHNIHHIHIWSLDGIHHCATMHIVTDGNPHIIKDRVRNKLREYGIVHATLELEDVNEVCHDEHCHMEYERKHHHHH